MIRLLPVLFLAVATVASAQQAPAPAAAAAPPVINPAAAAHKCPKPDDYPGRLASDTQRRNWTRNANGFLDCLKKYIGEQQAAYNAMVEKAKPHLEAANASIDEYNKAVAAFKAAQGET